MIKCAENLKLICNENESEYKEIYLFYLLLCTL